MSKESPLDETMAWQFINACTEENLDLINQYFSDKHFFKHIQKNSDNILKMSIDGALVKRSRPTIELILRHCSLKEDLAPAHAGEDIYQGYILSAMFTNSQDMVALMCDSLGKPKEYLKILDTPVFQHLPQVDYAINYLKVKYEKESLNKAITINSQKIDNTANIKKI